MKVTLHSRMPVADRAQEALFASGRGIFPGGHFRSDADVARRLDHLARRRAGPLGLQPEAVRSLLESENAFAPLAPEQRANLDAAGSPDAVFILTGQQPALLGGPVLWYYKALTCAALARQWSARLGRPVIPLFWAAGDDSDLRESNHLELLDVRAGEVATALSLSFPDPGRPLAVGARGLPRAEMERLLAGLEGIWDGETAAAIRRCYLPSATLTEGFLRLARSYLGREGILFVDGFSASLRAAAQPVLREAVRGRAGFQAGLEKGTAALAAAGLPPQVEVRPGLAHAFALRDGERHRLYGGTGAAGEAQLYTADRPAHDLTADLREMPLTHDVFTRPLVADAVFPVLGHVLGPAELRYFGQLAPVFRERTGDMPLAHPRMTAVVVPADSERVFREEGWELSEAVKLRPSMLRERLADRAWVKHPASRELSLEPGERWLEALRRVQERHFRDPGPGERLERAMRASWGRYVRAWKRRMLSETVGEKAELFTRLRWMGNGMGQDRHMNIHSLADALGRDGLAALRELAEPTVTDLQVFLFESREDAGR